MYALSVLEIEQRGQHARRTKDIWEDPKAGGPKNLIAEEAWGTNKIQEAERERKLNIHIELDKTQKGNNSLFWLSDLGVKIQKNTFDVF